MSRRQARELALQSLFQLELNSAREGESEAAYQTLALDVSLAEFEKVDKKTREYAMQLLQGVCAHIEQLDLLLVPALRGWKLDRLATIDRNIARIATFEMGMSEERLKSNIAVNEAVELAKKYGSDDSPRFLNGVLGTVSKHLNV